MAIYRFLTTNILTGELLADNIPVVVQSAQRQLNGIGQLTGSLQMDISGYPLDVQVDYIAAITPWKSVFWVIQDGIPIWAGPITSWNPTTLVGGNLPFSASTMETIFQYRIINEDVNYVSEDVATMFYGLGLIAMQAGTNSQIAGFYLNSTDLLSGVEGNFEQTGTNFQSCYDCWTTLVDNYDVEFTIDPSWATQVAGASALQQTMRVGYEIGRKFADTGLTFTYPSRNALDYQYLWQGTSVANQVIAYGTTAAAAATTYISEPADGGTSATDLDEGFPLLQSVVQIQNPIDNQAQANAYAASVVQTTAITGQITPIVVLGADAIPKLSDIQLGDEVMFLASSAMHPKDPDTGAPRLQKLFRITGWTLYPPSPGVPETCRVQLGGIQPVSSN